MGAALLGSRQPRAIWLYLGICLAGLSRSASSTTVPGLGCRSAGVQRRVFPRLSLRGGRERPAAARPRVSDVVSAVRKTRNVAGGKDEKAMQAMVFPVLLRGLVGLQEQDVRDLLEDCGAPVAVKFAGRASSTKRKAIVFFGDRAEARRAHKINGCVVADGAVRSSLLPPVPREEVTAVSAAVGKAGECVPRWRGSPTVECPMAVEGARACAQTWHLTGMRAPSCVASIRVTACIMSGMRRGHAQYSCAIVAASHVPVSASRPRVAGVGLRVQGIYAPARGHA